MTKHTVVICEYGSTGVNFIDDVTARGLEPVLLEARAVGTKEEIGHFAEQREFIKKNLGGKFRVIGENPDYDEVLSQVRKLEPVAVIAGSEFGVDVATRLAEDLGLPGNPVSSIPAMTKKDAMQSALKDKGLRYIRGKVISSEEEAEEYFRELGKDVVIKRTRGAGTQGVYLCCGHDEMIAAVKKSLETNANDYGRKVEILMQERITGTEYVVNTVSCNGKHRVVSMWQYDKIKMPNGTNAYNKMMVVPELDVGLRELASYALSVASAIGIKYGPVHGEYMVDENGPVLIEVNCRPMGGSLDREYTEAIFGHHETDVALDSYLNPASFDELMKRPYRIKKFGGSKIFIIPHETVAETEPVIQIAKHLKSYYLAMINPAAENGMLGETISLTTAAGEVYMLHEDESVVRSECAFLELLEKKYPRILYQDTSVQQSDDGIASPDLNELLRNEYCHGAVLVFSDTKDSMAEGATVVGEDGLKDAYDSFDCGIFDLSKPDSFRDLESVFQMIFTFFGKIRSGGKILVPESTYRHLPYGNECIEILLKVKGYCIEMPKDGSDKLIVATVS